MTVLPILCAVGAIGSIVGAVGVVITYKERKKAEKLAGIAQ